MKKILLWKHSAVKRMNVSFNAIGKISFKNPWSNLFEFGLDVYIIYWPKFLTPHFYFVIYKTLASVFKLLPLSTAV